jgi:hypothetical protein
MSVRSGVVAQWAALRDRDAMKRAPNQLRSYDGVYFTKPGARKLAQAAPMIFPGRAARLESQQGWRPCRPTANRLDRYKKAKAKLPPAKRQGALWRA